MRGDFKVFDADTHLNPMAETLEPYFDSAYPKAAPRVGEFKGSLSDRLGRRNS